MSIDGIGRPPRPPGGIGPSEGPLPAAGAEKAFQVERGAETQAVSSSSAVLTRLEKGEISVDQYLDARVDDALAPLATRLPPEQLEFVKSSLRAELATDPVLVELLKRVTAAVPGSTEL
jgi:hypothetical protein